LQFVKNFPDRVEMRWCRASLWQGDITMPDLRQLEILVAGRGLVESPRWHDGRFWFADWTAGEILSIEPDGTCKVQARAPAPPLCFDFAATGEMLIVSSAAGKLLKGKPGEAMQVFADLGTGTWNEIVVDGRGNSYVNGPALLLITTEGRVSKQAEEFAFPNGMAVTPDNRVLIVAESYGSMLTAFDIGEDGHLSGRRVWAALDGPPDGICIDKTGAVWYADVAHKYCRRVKEGGEVLDEVQLDRGAFACMTGGPERQTMLITAATWFGMDRMPEMAGTGRVLTVGVPVAGAGWP
jgi:sugar lactone lactonase YvrE